MFCPHCGNQLEGDSLFCSACGGRIDAGAETPAAPEQTPGLGQTEFNGDFTMGSGTSFPGSAFAAPDFDAPQPEEPKKKKRLSKKAIIGMISGTVAVALIAVVIGLNWQWIRGKWILLFGSDEDYFEFVEEKQAKTYAKALSAAYSSPMDLFGMDSSGTSTVTFDADEQLLAAFLQEMGIDYNGDLSFLSEVQFKTEHNITEEGMSASIGLVISGQTILTANMTVDYEAQTIYYSFPELSDKVLTMRISTGGGRDLQQALEIMDQLDEEGIMPSESEMESILERYIGVIINAVDNVNMRNSTLQVNGVSQDCKKITARITERTMNDIMIAVLREVKNDKDLKALFQKAMSSDAAYLLYGAAPSAAEINSLYDDLLAGIDEEIEYLRSRSTYMMANEPEEIFTLIDYVNSSHEVIGREISIDEETVIFYGTARDGKKVGTKLELSSDYFGTGILFQGSGTKDGDKVTGDYVLTVEERRVSYNYSYDDYYGYGYDSQRTVTYEEHEVCNIHLTDFDVKALQEGRLNGKVRVSPSGDLMEGLLGSRLASVLNVSVEFDFRTAGNSESVDIDLLVGDSVMFSIGVNSELADSQELTTPSGPQVDGNYGLTEFERSLSFDRVRNSLRNTNLPREIIAYAEELIDELEREFSRGGYYDDYWYDDYWYDDYWYGY